MLHNFIKVASRNILKNRGHSLINIGGLAVGLMCAVIIFLVIRHETSYDTHHENGDRIYRLVRHETELGQDKYDAGVPVPLPDALRQDFPNQIEELTIVDANSASEPVVTTQRRDGTLSRFREGRVAFAEPSYFRIFSYRWVRGNGEGALERPNTAVIGQELARRLFGEEDPLGRTITLQGAYDLEVTAVFRDPPATTDLPFQMLASFGSVGREGETRRNGNWGATASSVQCYFLLRPGVAPASLNARMDDFLAKYRNEEIAATTDYRLQPLSQIHFDSRYGNYSGKVVPMPMLWALGLIGLFLLLAACINFVNLNTAVAVSRSREVGIRKALGGTRPQLAGYFLGETALVTFLAFVLALALSEVAVRLVEPLIGFRPELALLSDPQLLLFLGALFLATTLAAGLYPALYISGFNPIRAIRNSINASYGRGLTLRRSLVIVQFTISQVLIICTLVISFQMDFLRSADMGFEEDAVVEVDLPSRDPGSLGQFRNALESHSAIRGVAFSNTGTAHGNTWGGNYILPIGEERVEGNAQIKFVEPEFLDTYGIELVAGRNLAPSDTVREYLVNEAFVREAGFDDRYQEVIGTTVNMWGNEAPIVGVVRDFNTNSFHRRLEPVMLSTRRASYFLAAAKIDMERTSEAIAAMEKAFEAAFPDYVFDYVFLDTRIDNFYKKEQATARMAKIFTFIAVVIGCLGLFGMVSYMAATRTKEVSVRKVLGAGMGDILLLFSREFVLLIGTSFLVSAPLAYLLMSQWLEGFAYRIDLGIGLFALAFGATLLVALLTVGYKSLRTASLNPAETLKSE